MEDAIGGFFAGILVTILVGVFILMTVDFHQSYLDLEIEHTNYCNSGIPTTLEEGYNNDEGKYYLIVKCFGLGGE